MIRWEQIDRARDQIAKNHEIVSGRGVIVYDLQARAWALPGGTHTQSRECAERAAKLVGLMVRKQISGPRIARGKR